jgi:hypothetical protein
MDPMSGERAQYDGDELDEIVAENVTVHIELLDAHHWMIRIYRQATWTKGVLTRTAVDIHLSGNDLFEVEDTRGLPVIQRGPVAYCHIWRDRSGREHKCYDHTPKRHRCTCGASKAVEA